MSKYGEYKPPKRGAPSRLDDDPRFAHIKTDPTFRGGRKKQRVKIDSRFAGALDDDRFGVAAGKIDKRGRRVGKTSNQETLAPFYELEDKDGGLTDAEQKRKAALDARARGEDDDDDSSSSSSEESDVLEEAEVEAWDAGLPPTCDEVEGDVETSRLAVTDQEWKHCRAQDLLVMLGSLCPPGGRCARVAVYASEYGAAEMAREERFGPEGIFVEGAEAGGDGGDDSDDSDDSGDDAADDSGDGSGDDSDASGDAAAAAAADDSGGDSGDDSGGDSDASAGRDAGFDAEKLRRYELRKLRRYFAIAEFDRPATAAAAYAAGDGVEIEATSVPLTLSFVPEDQAFDAKRLRDEATSADSYAPPKAYCCAARQRTKVDCTFDDDDGRRANAFDEMIKDPDAVEASEYVADSDSDDGGGRAGTLRGLLGLDAPAAAPAADPSHAGFDDDFFGAEDGERGAEDVEVTFEDFGAAADGGEKAGETPWEARERRKRERKAERKKKLKDQARASREKKEKRDPAKSKKPAPAESDSSDAEDARDFDAKALVRAEKLKTKKLKGKKKAERDRLAKTVDQGGFAFDAGDDRFRGLLDGDDRFGVDPASGSFRDTAAMKEVLAEQASRRRKQRASGPSGGDDGDARDDAPAARDLAAAVRAKLKGRK